MTDSQLLLLVLPLLPVIAWSAGVVGLTLARWVKQHEPKA